MIPRGCSVGFDRRPRTYEGITIPIGELSISAPLSQALKIDAFKNVPPAIRKPIQEKIHFFRPVAVDINASPMVVHQIDFSSRSIITVGSQGYNIVTNYCYHHNLSQLQIVNNGTAIEIVRGVNRGEIITRPDNCDIAILERLVDNTRNDTTIIIAAGLAVLGTMGAVHYLIDHWLELYQVYGDRDFALVLQFGPIDTQPIEEALKGSVVRSLPPMQ